MEEREKKKIGEKKREYSTEVKGENTTDIDYSQNQLKAYETLKTEECRRKQNYQLQNIYRSLMWFRSIKRKK